MLGRIQPRLWTRPLVEGPPGDCGCGCALTPATTHGFAVEAFAIAIGRPLDAWQRWLVIHALELLPNGWPRFRQVLVLVARQNGKTELLVILTLFWMWVQQVGTILGTSTKLQYARESWQKAVKLARRSPELRADIADRSAVRNANGEQEMRTPWDSRYLIAPAKDDGGRSLTIARLIEDELRQHHDWSAHEAAENAMNAVVDGQAWAITNEGDDRSVVLHALYDSAIEFIDTGEGDERLGLFAWSAPLGCDLLDVEATAQANPNLNRIRPDGSGIELANLMGKARRAKAAGGQQEAKYRTEVLCQRVLSLADKPIPADLWASRRDPDSQIVGAITIGIDVSPDRRSASVAVAGRRDDGLAHLELARTGQGVEWVVAQVVKMADEQEIYDIVDGQHVWPAIVGDKLALEPLMPAFRAEGIVPVLLSLSDQVAGCAGLQDALETGSVRHPGQQQLTAALEAAVKRDVGDGGWAWGKRLSAAVDADISGLVAATGAHKALTEVRDDGVWGFFE